MSPDDVDRFGPERAGMLAAVEAYANGTSAVIRLGAYRGAERPTVADQHADYTAGRSDQPDPLAPARGVLVGLALGVPFAVGLLWPFGQYLT